MRVQLRKILALYKTAIFYFLNGQRTKVCKTGVKSDYIGKICNGITEQCNIVVYKKAYTISI